MRQDFRFAGSGGQGVILLSVILANAYGMHQGMEVAQTQSYGPEARGGTCKSELVVSDTYIEFVKVLKNSVFVTFNEVSFEKYKKDLQDDTVIFADSTFMDTSKLEGYNHVHTIDATAIADEKFKPFTVNIIMLGFMAAILEDLQLEAVEKAVTSAVPKKALQINMDALHYGYELGKK